LRSSAAQAYAAGMGGAIGLRAIAIAAVLLAASAPGIAQAGCVWQQTPAALSSPIGDTVAVSPSDAWLFGGDYGNLQRWNGAAWTDTGSRPITFVSAADGDAPDDVWEVNLSGQSARFDGVSWTRERFAGDPNSVHAYAISVVSPTLAFEGGYSNVSQSAQMQRWDGTRWHVFNAPSTNRPILSVSALGPRNIWAAVELSFSSDVVPAHWDGTSWTIFDTNPRMVVSAISARASKDVWAVGPGFGGPPHAYHFDGSTWSDVPLPAPVPPYAQLDDVSAQPGSPTIAVGYRLRDHTQIYILQFSNGAWKREHADTDPSHDVNGHGLTHLSVLAGTKQAWATNNDDYVIHRACT
jgi:hypothetical protein